MTYQIWVSCQTGDDVNHRSVSTKLEIPGSLKEPEIKIAMREATFGLLAENEIEQSQVAASGWFRLR